MQRFPICVTVESYEADMHVPLLLRALHKGCSMLHEELHAPYKRLERQRPFACGQVVACNFGLLHSADCRVSCRRRYAAVVIGDIARLLPWLMQHIFFQVVECVPLVRATLTSFNAHFMSVDSLEAYRQRRMLFWWRTGLQQPRGPTDGTSQVLARKTQLHYHLLQSSQGRHNRLGYDQYVAA